MTYETKKALRIERDRLKKDIQEVNADLIKAEDAIAHAGGEIEYGGNEGATYRLPAKAPSFRTVAEETRDATLRTVIDALGLTEYQGGHLRVTNGVLGIAQSGTAKFWDDLLALLEERATKKHRATRKATLEGAKRRLNGVKK